MKGSIDCVQERALAAAAAHAARARDPQALCALSKTEATMSCVLHYVLVGMGNDDGGDDDDMVLATLCIRAGGGWYWDANTFNQMGQLRLVIDVLWVNQ